MQYLNHLTYFQVKCHNTDTVYPICQSVPRQERCVIEAAVIEAAVIVVEISRFCQNRGSIAILLEIGIDKLELVNSIGSQNFHVVYFFDVGQERSVGIAV